MRKSIAIWMGLSLLIGGCKISSDRLDEDPSTIQNPEPSAQLVSLQGRVNKGVVKGARVTLYPFGVAGYDDSEVIAEAVTGEQGRFSLDVEPSALGQPVFLEVTSIEGQSEIRCDVAKGCGDYGFGANIPLSNDFRLTLAVPVLRSNTSFSVTLLTHLAAQLVVQSYSTDQELQPVVNRLNLRMQINQSNSRVASRFGVTGDLVSLGTVDLTSQEEVAQAGDRELWYSALGAGVWHAALEANPQESDIEDIIESFESLYITTGLRSHREEGDLEMMVSYEQVLDGVRELVLYLQETMTEVELSSLLTEINTARGLAASETDNQPDLGTASATANLTEVEQARSLIESISKITAAVNLQQLVSLADISSLTDPKVAASIDQFGFELSAAQIIEGKRFDQLLSGFGRIIRIVLDSMRQVVSSPGGSLPKNINGVEFTLTHHVSPNNPLKEIFEFHFERTFTTCDEGGEDCLFVPSMDVRLVTDNLYADLRGQFIAADRFEFAFSGVAKVGALTLTFADNQAQAVVLDSPKITDLQALEETTEEKVLEFTGFEDGSTAVERCPSSSVADPGLTHYQLEFSSVNVRLPVILEHNGTAGAGESITLRATPLVSSGPINAAYFKGRAECQVSSSVLNQVHLLSELKISQLENLNLSVNTSIENASKDKAFVAALGLSQARSYLGSPVSYWSADDYLCADSGEKDLSQCEQLYEGAGFLGETEGNFLPLAASVGFKANLAGLADPVLLEVSGAREGPEKNRIDRLKLRYPGHAVSLQGTFSHRTVGGKQLFYIAAMDAANLDGISISLGLSSDSNRRGEVVNSLNEQIAKIVDMGQWLKVTFDDGSFKALCGYC